VRCSHDRCVELTGAYDDIVEVSNLAKPQQDASTDLGIGAHEEPVVMFDISMMELKHQSSIAEQSFVVRAAMVTVKAKELLIPAAGCFHVAYGDHGLGLSCPNRDHADAVSGWPSISTSQRSPPSSWSSVHCATVADDSLRRQAVGRDHRTGPPAAGACSVVGWSYCFKASAGGVD
jgi:hypothetical protein